MSIDGQTDRARDAVARLEARGVWPLVRDLANEGHVTLDELFSGVRTDFVVNVRRKMFAALKGAGLNSSEIARLTGFDAGTVQHGLRRLRGAA